MAIKSKKTYEIDSIKYNSKSLKEYHIELLFYKKSGIIDSFKLPDVNSTFTSKLGNKKPYIDNHLFDSLDESRFYVLLKDAQVKGKIERFEMQKEYVLQPSFKKGGKTIRKISYFADFVIYYPNGNVSVVDVKGLETDVFKLKHKMFEYAYPELTLKCYRRVNADNSWLPLEEYKKIAKEKKSAKKKAATAKSSTVKSNKVVRKRKSA